MFINRERRRKEKRIIYFFFLCLVCQIERNEMKRKNKYFTFIFI